MPFTKIAQMVHFKNEKNIAARGKKEYDFKHLVKQDSSEQFRASCASCFCLQYQLKAFNHRVASEYNYCVSYITKLRAHYIFFYDKIKSLMHFEYMQQM